MSQFEFKHPMLFPVSIKDQGDSNDSVKWDFPEDNIPVYFVKNDLYPYKAQSKENAQKLSNIRSHIRKLCHRIKKGLDLNEINGSKEYIDGVRVFLDIHQENNYNPEQLPEPFFQIAYEGYPTSRYLLSEIPKDIGYSGMSKPKQRFIDTTGNPVGKDGKIRPLYRDVFLDLDDENLDALIIHELAHTMANHVNFRVDDHGKDFKWAENVIKKYW